MTTAAVQEVFNTVCDHLMKQGRRSEGPRPDMEGHVVGCRYRATDLDTGETLKCAVGVLIPDDVYSEEMEGKAWAYVAFVWPSVGDTVAKSKPFIGLLQYIHDMKDVEAWPSELRNVANANGLELPASVKEKL